MVCETGTLWSSIVDLLMMMMMMLMKFRFSQKLQVILNHSQA